jgi:hypothetical protein
VKSADSQPTFRKNMSPSSSGSKTKPSKEAVETLLVSYPAYTSTLRMVTCYSETSVDFQRTTKDRTLKGLRNLGNVRPSTTMVCTATQEENS